MNDNLHFDALRNLCRATFEALEIWLRNIIEYQLTISYGANYFDALNESGDRVIKKSLFESVNKRLISEPDRFGRFIDATFFEDLIDIICNPKLYNSHFEEPLKNAFVLGREQARVYLFKIKDIRNFLSHSNHIANRQAEQLSCYSKDVIDSIKIYFQAINKEKEFNVPSIRTFKDSEGSNIFSSQFLDLNTHKYIDLKSVNLYQGDSISLEVQVDESFDEMDYIIKWLHNPSGSVFNIKESFGPKLTLIFGKEYVSETYKIECYIISKKEWHKFLKYDDKLIISYKIKPVNKELSKS